MKELQKLLMERCVFSGWEMYIPRRLVLGFGPDLFHQIRGNGAYPFILAMNELDGGGGLDGFYGTYIIHLKMKKARVSVR